MIPAWIGASTSSVPRVRLSLLRAPSRFAQQTPLVGAAAVHTFASRLRQVLGPDRDGRHHILTTKRQRVELRSDLGS
jgi:hypothetical protein